MEKVLGKSDGTTLLEHIEDCLGVFSQLREALPQLKAVTQQENFWELLFYVIYLHDWGKSHREFQKILTNDSSNVWNHQRHEVYSVPFVEKLDLSDKDQLLVKRAILGHHKNFSQLSRKLKSPEEIELEFDLIWKKKNQKFHPEDFLKNLRCSLNVEYLKFLIKKFSEYNERFLESGQNSLSRTVDLLAQKHPVVEIANSTRRITFLPEDSSYWQNLLLGGAAKICDHYGSAQIKLIHSLASDNFNFLVEMQHKLKRDGKDFYFHQKRVSKQMGNCILIAPTGSGKTEAAMGWLKRQLDISQGRVFYILPYTASINAMHQRLLSDFSTIGEQKAYDLIGIQHGKLTHYLANFYDELTDAETECVPQRDQIKVLRDLYRKMVHPLKITTPFQILKYCYGVKGFEMGFTSLVGAKLIFDEIHAYDAVTFAQILISLKFLIRYLKCSVFIMTATLPTFMVAELKKVLGVNKLIRADEQLLANFTRHRVKLLEGTIFDQFSLIEKYFSAGKRLIIVCNTVQNAQEIYQVLLDQLPVVENNITLLHSRFNAQDRSQKEARTFCEDNKILIGTQAIEVSLDIDYDVMFTEPAPLDALMQRFGRVNRRRKKGIAPVYVCTEGGEHDHYIYPQEVIKRTLDNLVSVDIIKEAELQRLLDAVYPNWEANQAEEFNNTYIGFEQALNSLQPYSEHKESEEEFYAKFDGIQVLPACFFTEYKKLINELNFIEADRLLVTIHKGMYFKLKNESKIENRYFVIETPSRKIIKKYILIAKCQYSEQIGMTNQFQEVDDGDNMF